MDPTWKAIFWGLAIIVFAVDALAPAPATARWRWQSIGLALLTVPFFWDAVEAA